MADKDSRVSNDHKFSLNWKSGSKDRNLDRSKRFRSPNDLKEEHSNKKMKKKKEKKAKREKKKKKKKSQTVDKSSPRNVIASGTVQYIQL